MSPYCYESDSEKYTPGQKDPPIKNPDGGVLLSTFYVLIKSIFNNIQIFPHSCMIDALIQQTKLLHYFYVFWEMCWDRFWMFTFLCGQHFERSIELPSAVIE